MSRKSWTIVLVIVAVLAVGAEVYVRSWTANRAGVQIVNETGAAIEGLVVSFADTRIEVGHLNGGASTLVRLSGPGKGTLTLDYHQQGNPVAGFQIGEFDPAYLSAERFRMILTIRPNQIERIVEDDEASPNPNALASRLLRWIEADLKSAR